MAEPAKLGPVDPRQPSALAMLENASSDFTAAAITRMHDTLPWYRAMPPEARSWVGLVVQAGIAAFMEWYRDPAHPPTITTDVFGTAPRELARTITLRQTVELVRSTISVVEEWADQVPDRDLRAGLREGVLSYSREIAFAAAGVYAQAAEARGAWDARLEALVVDAVIRGDDSASIASRAAALGWRSARYVIVVVGRNPETAEERDTPDGRSAGTVIGVVEQLRRDARTAHVDLLSSTYGDQMVAVLGGAEDVSRAAVVMAGRFGPGAVVIGPKVDGLEMASVSARAAMSGLRASSAWPSAPRPVSADDLLPERALSGEVEARRMLVDEVYRPLFEAGLAVISTLAVYLEQAPSIEATARALFVHPNTVRYRLRRVAEITGRAATDARGAYTLRLALAYGRLDHALGGHSLNPIAPVT